MTGYDFLDRDEGKQRFRKQQTRPETERPRRVSQGSTAPIDGPAYREQLIAAGLLRPAGAPRLTPSRLADGCAVLRLDANSRAFATLHIAEGDHGQREMHMPRDGTQRRPER